MLPCCVLWIREALPQGYQPPEFRMLGTNGARWILMNSYAFGNDGLMEIGCSNSPSKDGGR